MNGKDVTPGKCYVGPLVLEKLGITSVWHIFELFLFFKDKLVVRQRKSRIILSER